MPVAVEELAPLDLRLGLSIPFGQRQAMLDGVIVPLQTSGEGLHLSNDSRLGVGQAAILTAHTQCM